ncbi:MAG: hypothetical protein O3C40_22430 [Planctomycetota bacterium]|nr:hypothetical protein [Planctomycetota bacterium]
MKMLRQLWLDEHGVLATTDLLLLTTILVIGMIVGLTSLRDSVVQELADMASAVGSLDQSYSFANFTFASFSVAGSSFGDPANVCLGGVDVTLAPQFNNSEGAAP